MPSKMRHFFAKSKGSSESAQSPEMGTCASSACACSCHLIHGQPERAENITMPLPGPAPAPQATPVAAPAPVPTITVTLPQPAASSLAQAAPTPVKGTFEPGKSHSKRDNLLNGMGITLSVLADAGAISKVPFLKDVANVTKSLVELIQTVLQNNESLRELIKNAIALGRCIIDAINACFTAGEALPEAFEQHVRLLLDTLNEVKELCLDILKSSKAKKAFDTKPIKDKIEAYRRRIQGALDFFQLRSNISVEAHFAKWTKFLEEKFPLNGFIPQPAPVPQISNVDNSQTHTTNAAVNSHSFNCSPGGMQAGLGNQMNVMGPGMNSSSGAPFDGLAFQRAILERIPHLRAMQAPA